MHRALEGDGPLPIEWIVGRMCEEFHCLPSAAWREYLDSPAGWIETILDYRLYGRAKAAYDARGQKRHDPPLTDLVTEHAFTLVTESRRTA